MIIDRPADMLTHSASYTTLGRDDKPLGIKIHAQRIRGTF
jgi:hypothetical protein